MKKSLLIIFLLVSVYTGRAQTAPVPAYTILDTISNEYLNSVWYVSGNDTLVKATHSVIEISAASKNRHRKAHYDKLQKRVIKTYPYAKAASEVMDMYEAICKEITDPAEQKKLLDMAESEMKKQFEKDLRDMTINEGIVLIKLIDRETGENSYELVHELKGRFSAFMWQSVARIFGHNLKDEYEAEGEDVWIENIVLQIEDGAIPVQLRKVDPFGLKAYSMNH